MKTWVRKTLSVGVLAAGALLFAPGGAAHADVRQGTGLNDGILNGTQLVAPVTIPVNASGNALSILGAADAAGASFNRVEGTHGVTQATGVNDGIANGSQLYLPVDVPINAVGNAAAVGGISDARGVGGNEIESAHVTEGHRRHGGDGPTQFTGFNNGILNGTQLYAPVNVPINICGNSLAAVGFASSQAFCGNQVGGHRHAGPGFLNESTQVNQGAANGGQFYAPQSLPANLGGNGGAVVGKSVSRTVSGNKTESLRDWPGGQFTGSNHGIGNGTQVYAPVNVPINVCGNSLSLLGVSSAAASCQNDIHGGGGHDVFLPGHDHGGFLGDDGWDGDFDGPDGDCPDVDADHGHQGHGHGGHGGHVKGDHGDKPGSYLGDNGEKPDHGNGVKDDNNGYGQPGDTTAGDKGNKDDNTKGYGNVSPDKYGDKGSKGGRDKGESASVSDLTDTSGIGSLGLLNTLR